MINFDEKIDRRGTNAHKWDATDDKDIIPLWVADMDFLAAPAIREAIMDRARHGVFGYSDADDGYYRSITDWFGRRHGWTISPDQIISCTGVIPALSATIKALARQGDGIIIQPPVYNCFFSCISNNNCRIVENELIQIPIDSHTFTFNMDYEGLENACADKNNKFLILCNPHNPAGRNWTQGELERLHDICSRHGVRVICDEIHCELTAPGTDYIPYATIDDNAVILCSPSKSFNIAGLHFGNIVCRDAPTRVLIKEAIEANVIGDVNPFAIDALKAAYSRDGEMWLDQLRGYIFSNYRFMCDYLSENLPQCPVSLLEATYLPVIDVKCFGIKSSEIETRLKEEAHVWVNASEMYGRTGYLRINIACPRQQLAEGLGRLAAYLNGI